MASRFGPDCAAICRVGMRAFDGLALHIDIVQACCCISRKLEQVLCAFVSRLLHVEVGGLSCHSRMFGLIA